MIDAGLGVILRRIKENDLEKMFEWRNDPLIWKWCRQNSPLHWIGHLSWFKRQVKDSRLSMFAVTNGDYMIGVAGLTDIDLINRRAEFSLYINPLQQGKGYGEKALRTLFIHGFNDLGLNSIWGETFDGNPAYDMFIKKLGMIHEGTRRNFYFRDGRFTDCHLVSISSSEFFDKHKDRPNPATACAQVSEKDEIHAIPI